MSAEFVSNVSGLVKLGKDVRKYGDRKSYTTYYAVLKVSCTGLMLPEEKTGYVQPGDVRIKVPISEAMYNEFRALKRNPGKSCPLRATGRLEIIADRLIMQIA